jgi:hypothetical protein
MQLKDLSQDHRFFSASILFRALGFLLLAIPVCAAFPFVKKVSHTSAFLDTAGRADFLIYLPPGYENSGLRYSAVFYLHGSTDNAYTDTCQAGVLDRLIAAKEVNPMIIVYLNVTSTGGYRDRGPGDMQESFIIKDIIPHIDKTYRTIGTPESRALDGFSMGAAGSLRLGFAHPKLFSAVMAWDGGITTSEIATLAETNAADIKGRMDVRLYSRPPSGQALVPETLKKLGVAYEHFIVDTDHVGVLGESGPTNRRICNDPSRITAGWKFFSSTLEAPSSSVSIGKKRIGQSFDFNATRLVDFNIYTPAGKSLGEISARNQLPGRGLYLVQSKNYPDRKKLVYFD